MDDRDHDAPLNVVAGTDNRETGVKGRRLGHTDIRVSEPGVGCTQIPRLSRPESTRLVRFSQRSCGIA